MAEFYSARGWEIPPLPWTDLSPPFSPDGDPWVANLLHRKPAKLVAVAMDNKIARIAWVVMTRGEIYHTPQSSTEVAV